jgi:flagellar assembly factor FliW
MGVLISSERFGDVDCDESATLTFPHGLLGFEDQSSFVVVPVDEDGIYSWLQSTNDPALAFLATSPHYFFPDYAPEVNDSDLEELELNDPSETLLLCLVTIADDSITANLLGPIVVNTRTRRARQVVLSENRFSTREPLGGA